MNESRKPTLGIIGAGQLSRMLWEAAEKNCGIRTLVFAEGANSSAEKAGAKIVHGRLDRLEDVKAFLARVDRVIIESEFIPVSVLRELLRLPESTKWTPPIQSLLRVQTKLGQKDLLQNLEVPTAGFEALSRLDRAALLERLKQGPFVLKSSQGGYDGKGVLVVDEPADLEASLEAFNRANPKADIYLEEKVPYTKEVALVGCRDRDGQVFFYPLVESRQLSGVCEEVLTLEKELIDQLQARAERHATRIMEELDWQGVLSIEFFLTEDLRLLVNELAPRVHNSGHYTLNAAERSQFEVHVRAAMGERLEQRYFATRPAFAMLNLLGPDGFEGELPPLNFAPAGQVPVYDYAKGVSRPRRKLGHWNWVSETSVPRERMEFALDEMRAEWNRWLGEKTNGKESP